MSKTLMIKIAFLAFFINNALTKEYEIKVTNYTSFNVDVNAKTKFFFNHGNPVATIDTDCLVSADTFFVNDEDIEKIRYFTYFYAPTKKRIRIANIDVGHYNMKVVKKEKEDYFD
jgi:hypothetical protein